MGCNDAQGTKLHMEEFHCPEEWPYQKDGSGVDTFLRSTTDIHQIEAVAVMLHEMMGTKAGEFLLPAFNPNPPRSRRRPNQSVLSWVEEDFEDNS